MQHMAHDVPPVEIVTMGSNGPRIHAMLQPLADAGRFGLHAAGDLPEAMALARAALGAQGGVVLLSPGAPSLVRTAITWRVAVISPSWPDSTQWVPSTRDNSSTRLSGTCGHCMRRRCRSCALAPWT